MVKIIIARELTIRIKGRIHKNIIKAHINCDNVPILWKKHYKRIGHDRFYKRCQHFRENYFP